MNTTKIVYIGAGSMDFGTKLLRDIFLSDELHGSTLSLVDIDEENLYRTYDLAKVLNREMNAGLRIEASTNRRDVLSGAQFVVNSLAIERCDLWKQDFEIPKKYGIRHTLGENGGPGGLFFTLRTIPVIMDVARDMEELCPEAYFLNFSNPESRIIYALSKYTRIKCIGLCHGIFMCQEDVAQILGIKKDDVNILAAGINHFQWLISIRDSRTGKDLYPLFNKRELLYDPDFRPFSRRMFRFFGLYPSCDDHHIGEFLPYGWEAGEEGYDFIEDQKRRENMVRDINELTTGKMNISEWISPSGEKVAHVITGILNNKKQLIESGIVYNRGSISNLPYDSAVEVPIIVDNMGIHPMSIGDLPPGISKLLNFQVSVQQLAVEAAIKASRELAIQALLVDPVVNSTSAAEKILDELWEINKNYIRPCNTENPRD